MKPPSIFRSAFYLGTSLACAFFLTSPAHAGSYTYSIPYNYAAPGVPIVDSWSSGSHWSGTPVSAADTQLFFSPATPFSGTAIVTNDLGTFSLAKLSFGGSSSFALSVTINGGALNFSNNGEIALGSVASGTSVSYTVNNDISTSGTLAFLGSGNAANYFNGSISGSGTVSKMGSSSVTLSGANTYTGGTILGEGGLNIGSNTALGATESTFVINGGSINTNGGARTLTNNNAITVNNDFTFVGSNDLNLGAGAVTLAGVRTIAVNASTLGLGGDISGTGAGIVKTGAGTLALSGNNTLSGGVTVAGGTLALLGNSALSGGITLTGGDLLAVTPGSMGSGAITFAGGSLRYTAANSGVDFSGNLSTATGQAYRFNVDSGQSATLAGNFGNGSSSLTKSGGGILTLSGTNSHSGTTTITGGTLKVGSDPTSATASALGNQNNSLAIGGVGLDLNGHNQGIGALTGGTNTVGFIFNNANSTTSVLTLGVGTDYTGEIKDNNAAGATGKVALNLAGTGTVSLRGNNSYTGGTTITGVTVLLGSRYKQQPGAISTGKLGSGGIVNNGGIIYMRDQTVESNDISGTGFIKVDDVPFDVTLTGHNTYTGGTFIERGRVGLGNGGTLGNGIVQIGQAGILDFVRSDTYRETAAISGSGLIRVRNTGTISFSPTALSGFTGNVEVANGTLDLGFNLPNRMTVSGGTLRLSDNAGLAGVTLTSGSIHVASDSALITAANISVGATATITSDRLTSGAGLNHTLGSITLTDSTLNISKGANVSSGVAGVTFGSVTSNQTKLDFVNFYFPNMTLGAGTFVTIGSLGGILDVKGGGDMRINGTSDAVVLFQSGSGTVTVSGNNTFRNVIVRGGGTLVAANNANALGGGLLGLVQGNVVLAGDTGLGFGNNTLVSNDMGFFLGPINTVTTGGTITSDRGTDGAGVTHTLGALSIGAQTLTVAKGSHVTSGVAGLTFGAVTLSDNATFLPGAGTLLTLGSISGNTLNFTVNGAGDMLVGGVVDTGTGGVTKSGTGTLTLSGNNTFTGNVAVTGGTLVSAGNATALGSGSSALTLSGGNLTLANNTASNFGRNTTISSNATITSDRLADGAGVSHTLGTLGIGAQTLTLAKGSNVSSGVAGLSFGAVTLSGDATFAPGAGTLLTLGSVSGDGRSFTIDGAGDMFLTGVVGTGTGSITKAGSGTLTLKGDNTYTGGTLISAGTVQVGDGGTTGRLGSGGVNNNGALVYNRSDNLTEDNTISGSGSVTQAGSGVLTLSGSNDFTGSVTVNTGGTLQIANNNALGSQAKSVAVNGTLDANGLSQGVGGLNGSGLVVNNADTTSRTLTVGNGNGSGSFTGVIANNGGEGRTGSLGLVKTGSGTQVLAGNNTYTGQTMVNAGTLVLSGKNNMAIATVNNGATLQLQANNGNTANFTGASTAIGTGSATLNLVTGSTLQLRSDQSTTFNGSGNGYYSTLNFDVNAIGIATGKTLGFAANGYNVTFSTLNVTGGNGYTLALGVLTDRNGYGTNRINATTANVTINGLTNNNYGPGLGGTTTFTLDGTSTGNAVTGLISNGSGTINITKAGTGTWALTENNSYSGLTTVSGGTLQIGNGGTTGSLGSGAVTNNAALNFNRSNSLTQSNVISGSGGVAQNGEGTTILTGANTYTGATTVNAGTLQVGNGTSGKIDGTSSVITGADGAIAFNEANNSSFSKSIANNGKVVGAEGSGITNTLSGVISGTGSFTQSGEGTTILSGSNTYSGGSTVQAGVLSVGNNQGLGTGKVLLSGGTLLVQKGFTLGNEIQLAGGILSRELAGNVSLSEVAAVSSGSSGAGTKAEFLAGTLGGSSTDTVALSSSFSNTPTFAATNDSSRIGEVFHLSGTGSNVFVLQLTVSGVGADSYLGWLNGGAWVNAVEGSTGNNALTEMQGFNGTYAQFVALYSGLTLSQYIGAYGRDDNGDTVWAVINHNSDFSAVPEPTTWMLLVVGLLTLGWVAKRRKRKI